MLGLIKEQREENNNLQQKIDNAIEYIKFHIDYDTYFSKSELEDLLEILKGDKE